MVTNKISSEGGGEACCFCSPNKQKKKKNITGKKKKAREAPNRSRCASSERFWQVKRVQAMWGKGGSAKAAMCAEEQTGMKENCQVLSCLETLWSITGFFQLYDLKKIIMKKKRWWGWERAEEMLRRLWKVPSRHTHPNACFFAFSCLFNTVVLTVGF